MRTIVPTRDYGILLKIISIGSRSAFLSIPAISRNSIEYENEDAFSLVVPFWEWPK